MHNTAHCNAIFDWGQNDASVFQINWGSVLNYQVVYSGSTDQITYDLNSDGLEDILAFGAVYPGSGPGTAPFRVYLQNPDGRCSTMVL